MPSTQNHVSLLMWHAMGDASLRMLLLLLCSLLGIAGISALGPALPPQAPNQDIWRG